MPPNKSFNISNMLSQEIAQCREDMHQALEKGSVSLESQVRAYDLLEKLISFKEDNSLRILSAPASTFCADFVAVSESLDQLYDEVALLQSAEERLLPFKQAMKDAESRYLSAKDLHESARDTYDIWQSGGMFSRYRALRKLRSKAGFRLESDRLGNYVAKTYDLMNEASSAFARAQQAMFAANVAYKIKPGIYSQINSVLSY